MSDGYTYNPDDLIQGELEKGFYKQSEFERNIFLPNYNDFIAKKILELINPMDKTIIFLCKSSSCKWSKKSYR